MAYGRPHWPIPSGPLLRVVGEEDVRGEHRDNDPQGPSKKADPEEDQRKRQSLSKDLSLRELVFKTNRFYCNFMFYAKVMKIVK